MDIIEFVKANWLFILIALLIVIFIIRAMFKLAFVALIIGIVLMFVFGYTPSEIFNLGKNVANSSVNLYHKTVEPIIEKELVDAQYILNPDGTFVIKTTSVQLSGVQGGKKITVSYNDKQFDIDISAVSDLIRSHIESLQNF